MPEEYPFVGLQNCVKTIEKSQEIPKFKHDNRRKVCHQEKHQVQEVDKKNDNHKVEYNNGEDVYHKADGCKFHKARNHKVCMSKKETGENTKNHTNDKISNQSEQYDNCNMTSMDDKCHNSQLA